MPVSVGNEQLQGTFSVWAVATVCDSLGCCNWVWLQSIGVSYAGDLETLNVSYTQQLLPAAKPEFRKCWHLNLIGFTLPINENDKLF